MLSELLISSSGARQAAVLLHLTKPHPAERTNKAFQSGKNTLLSLVNADAFGMNPLCTSVGVVAGPAPPAPRCELQNLPLRARSSLEISWAASSLNGFWFSAIISALAASCTRAAGECVVCSSCTRVEARTLWKCPSFQTPPGTQSPNHLTAQVLIPSAHSLFNIKWGHLCRFFTRFPLWCQKEICVFPPMSKYCKMSSGVSLQRDDQPFLMKPLSPACRYLVSINLMSLPILKRRQLTLAFSHFWQIPAFNSWAEMNKWFTAELRS